MLLTPLTAAISAAVLQGTFTVWRAYAGCATAIPVINSVAAAIPPDTLIAEPIRPPWPIWTFRYPCD
ncbi:hypothetical protein GCM10023191_095930 [Actinoallomurus oryzae]|uniref:Uncharacterized protein n=1 Tax=Actinoallomurus oryzae TaxID=502180 RepID=A0ABP8R6V5_9ACTN